MDTEKLIRDVVVNVMKRLENEGVPQSKAGSSQASGNNNSNQESKVKTQENEVKPAERKVVCGVSVRHVHLCKEHLEILFGKDHKLSELRELYNPGFAAEETVTIVGPKLNAIQNVRVLGPLRSKSQVELAKTDCVILGIDAPVRPSGNLEGTASAVIVGPEGVVYLQEGVIRANRHIHMSPEDAEFFGISDDDQVDVRVPGPKGLTFNNVQVRVSPEFRTEMHIDTDDANAADITNGTLVDIVDASCIVPLEAQMAEKNGTPPSIPDGSFAGEITDINVARSIRDSMGGQPDSQNEEQNEKQPSSNSNKKIVITVENLDDYKDSGIKLSDNVILSPLARDEAKERGIKIY